VQAEKEGHRLPRRKVTNHARKREEDQSKYSWQWRVRFLPGKDELFTEKGKEVGQNRNRQGKEMTVLRKNRSGDPSGLQTMQRGGHASTRLCSGRGKKAHGSKRGGKEGGRDRSYQVSSSFRKKKKLTLTQVKGGGGLGPHLLQGLACFVNHQRPEL